MNPSGVQQLEEGGIITRRSMRAVRAGAVPEPASHEVTSVSSQNAILLFWGRDIKGLLYLETLIWG